MTLLTAALLGAIVAYAATKSARRKKGRNWNRQAALPPAQPALPALPPQTAEAKVWVPAVPSTSISFVDDCSLWQIVDPVRFSLEIRFIYYGERLRGLEDPYALTEAVAAYVAPVCMTNGRARNMGELDLYAQIFATVAELMFYEGLLDDEMWISTANAFDIWYIGEAQALSIAA